VTFFWKHCPASLQTCQSLVIPAKAGIEISLDRADDCSRLHNRLRGHDG